MDLPRIADYVRRVRSLPPASTPIEPPPPPLEVRMPREHDCPSWFIISGDRIFVMGEQGRVMYFVLAPLEGQPPAAAVQ
jgi:hypothetical protein